MKLFLQTLLLFFCTLSIVFGNNRPDIKIIESDKNKLIIEYTPIYSNSEINKDNNRFRIDFYNSFNIAFINYKKYIGYPDLPVRSILIGLPALNDNSVEVVSSEFEIIRDIEILPVPRFQKTDDSRFSNPFYEKNKEVYSKNIFLPENILELQNPGIAKENILANLIVCPVQYNPVTRELKKFSRIVIKIIFGKKNPKNIQNSISSISPVSDPLKNDIINFEQMKDWKVKEVPAAKLTSVKNSVLSSGDWYKIEVIEEGIYKLDASYLKNAGINLSGLDPTTIKIYGNGGEEVPENVSSSRKEDLVECAIYISGESDGSFNDNDFILFYGKGAYGWNYNSLNKKHSHYINHFSNSNYYFLTVGGAKGKRMQSIASLNNPNAVRINRVQGRYFYEKEVTNLISSGKLWFGQKLSNTYWSTSFSTPKFDGLVTDSTITYRVLCAARSRSASYFDLTQNDIFLGQVYVYYPASYYDDGNYAQLSDETDFVKKTTIKDNKLNLKLTYNANSSGDEGYLDWIEIFYPRTLTTSIDEISFTTPDNNLIAEYNLDGFSTSNIFIFNTKDHNDVKLIIPLSLSGGSAKFQTQATSGSVSQFYAVGNNGLKTPASVKKISNSNLHGITEGADFLIITHNDYLTEAERYKTYRETSKVNNLKTKVIDVANIFNEFSGGLQDPTAIRDFVKYIYENCTIKPAYLLLFGDGSYDYRNILKLSSSNDRNKVPVYETTESLDKVESYCSDDFFVRIIGLDERNDLGVGRLNVASQEEAKSAIDKIISYESNNNFGAWRNAMTFVADDGYTTDGDDGNDYTQQSEELAESYSPQEFEKRKIYIVSYPTIISSSGRLKPDANKAIVDHINMGTMIVNYIGHGNPELWAHEHIFLTNETPQYMTNSDKLAFFITATCDFGRYDEPQKQSGTEILFTKSGGGSIGTFSASRSVYAGWNFSISKALYQRLFIRESDRRFPRMGDVMYSVKQDYIYTNDNKFHLFADPTIRLNGPQYLAKIDSINGFSADAPVQLKALSKVILKGKIFKDNTIWNNFSGKMILTVNDASKKMEIKEGIGDFIFKQEGSILYKGECTISNGEFLSIFYIPKDISYENNKGRIGLYFNNSNYDGAGVSKNVIIGGSDTNIVSDNIGPVINIYLGERNFRDGDLVAQNPNLIVDLFDESGINISGGIGHRFEAWLNNETNSINLIDYYKGKTDSFQEGTAEYKFSSLSSGTHKLKVKAFDVYNNSSSKEVTFKVSNSNNLTVENILNYPNPFKNKTKFTFQHNQEIGIDVKIKIFTVAGRLIKTLEENGILDKFVEIEWDGRDQDGDEIANGVYLYKVIVKTQDGRLANESLGKVSIIK